MSVPTTCELLPTQLTGVDITFVVTSRIHIDTGTGVS